MKIALCQVAYAQVRTEERHASELSSQLRFGEPVRILDGKEDWSLIQTEHGYQGYVRSAQIFPIPDGQIPQFTGLLSFQKAAKLPLPYAAASFCWQGNLLEEFLISPDSPEPVSGNFGENLCRLASQFLSVPYVWGGKTQWGLDCSGLVQLALNLAGYSFPRDAWQQAECGEMVQFSSDNFEFKAGDLLFFRHPGKPIHHVAISLGASSFIHASDWVRIQSLSAQDPDYAADRKHTLCCVKRLNDKNLKTMENAILQLFS